MNDLPRGVATIWRIDAEPTGRTIHISLLADTPFEAGGDGNMAFSMEHLTFSEEAFIASTNNLSTDGMDPPLHQDELYRVWELQGRPTITSSISEFVFLLHSSGPAQPL